MRIISPFYRWGNWGFESLCGYRANKRQRLGLKLVLFYARAVFIQSYLPARHSLPLGSLPRGHWSSRPLWELMGTSSISFHFDTALNFSKCVYLDNKMKLQAGFIDLHGCFEEWRIYTLKHKVWILGKVGRSGHIGSTNLQSNMIACLLPMGHTLSSSLQPPPA